MELTKTKLKQTELGLIPEDWEVKSQKEIVKYINGRAFGLHEWEKSGVPVVRLQNLTNKGGNFYYSNLSLPDYQYMYKNDLIFMWSASFGPYIWWGDKAIFHYHIWKIECKDNQADKDFYYFKLLEITEELKKGTSGSTMLHLTKGFMENYLVSVPPLQEQKAIAQVLSDTDSLIQTIEQKLAKKRAIKQGAMQQLLTPKEGWELKKLGEVSAMSSGGTPPSKVAEYYDGNISWVSISDITKAGKFIDNSAKKITEKGLLNSSARMFPKNTVLLAMYASIGKCCIATEEVTTSQAILGIEVKSKLLNEYLYYFLLYNRDKLASQGQQGTQSNLNKGMVESIELKLPSINEQTRIATILSDMDAEIAQLEQKLDKYKLLKQGLMQELLTGRIRLV